MSGQPSWTSICRWLSVSTPSATVLMSRAADNRMTALAISPTHPYGHYGIALVLARRLGGVPASERSAAESRVLDELEAARDGHWPPYERIAREHDLLPLRDLPRFRALEARGADDR